MAITKNKTIKYGVILSKNILVGCVVKAKISNDCLRKMSGDLNISGKNGIFSVFSDSGVDIGVLDAKSSGILERSKINHSKCSVLEFSENHLLLKITTEADLVSDIEWQRRCIVSMFQKVPEYLGSHFGENLPTEAQFEYALALGVDLRDQTFHSISKAIDKAKKQKSRSEVVLNLWEREELYHYLSRSSNQRYDFLVDVEIVKKSEPERPKEDPAPIKFPKFSELYALNRQNHAPEKLTKEQSYGCMVFLLIVILVILFFVF